MQQHSIYIFQIYREKVIEFKERSTRESILRAGKRIGRHGKAVRAARIAKDQTHKAYNALSLNEMKKEGVQYWQWIHGGGTKTVRATHIKEHSKGGLNHSIFKIGELAYDPQAEKIKGVYRGRYIEPGELPFCSCFRRPVFKFD